MNISTLTCICGIALGVFLVTTALHLNAYGKPEQEYQFLLPVVLNLVSVFL